LIKGKCIIFVGDIDRSYRLKLFLEQFGLRSCVLNSELPVNSRIHIVDEFNKNIYDIIIATDEHESFGEEDDPKENSIDEVSQRQIGIEHTNGGVHSKKLPKSAASKKRKTTKKDKEYGISRGIDFKNVACVLNFDLPTSSRAYTHRIGRTARAGNTGMALSFVIPKDQYRQHKSTSFPTTEHDEAILSKITQHQAQKGKDLHPYHFDMKQVDAFRYRMGDALRAVSRIAIREARTRELRQELLKSEKLKRHFEEHPDDLHHLRHDGELRAAKVQPHLKHVPDYLLPSEGKNALAGAGAGAGDGVGFVGLNKAPDSSRTRKGKLNDRFKGRGRRVGGKPTDPLKTFKTKKR
jgi:ATP-dependent RNA helicase DDX56/DBP9